MRPPRDEPAERGVCRCGKRAERGVEKRFEFFDEHAAVERAVAAAETRVTRGRVLSHAAGAGVAYTDKDCGFDAARRGEVVGGGVGSPGVAAQEGGAAVEEVLTVVKIEDRKVTRRLAEIGLREMDEYVARVGQEPRFEASEAAESVGSLQEFAHLRRPWRLRLKPRGCGPSKGSALPLGSVE